MSSPDRGSGPQVTQNVLFNNAGTITAAVIYGVNPDGSVNLVYFSAAGATSVTGVLHDMHISVGRWAYPQFQ